MEEEKKITNEEQNSPNNNLDSVSSSKNQENVKDSEQIQKLRNKPKNKDKKEEKKTQNGKMKKKKKEKEFTPHDLEELRERLDKKENKFLEKLVSKRFVKKSTHDIIIRKLVTMSLVSILLLIGILYALSYTYSMAGLNGISIVADRVNSREISLSESSSFEKLSVGLKAKGISSMDNVTYDWLPILLDNAEGGSHNGDNYISYTFFVLNTGLEQLTYTSSLYILRSSREVEKAIRVLVFKNGSPTVYTHTFESQIDEVLQTGRGLTVKEFYSKEIIAQDDYALEKGVYDRYTIVIWLEGEDLDCTDDKRSGSIEIAWRFTVQTQES